MRILGAVLAGGRSTRFGSDKAVVEVAGVRLIDRAAAALARQTDAVVIVGREEPRWISVPDRPAGGLGPLGGLSGALHYAMAAGYEVVLTAPCDIPDLPDLGHVLLPADRYLVDAPVIGAWRSAHGPALDAFIARDARRSVRGWAKSIAAMPVSGPTIPNINTPADLSELRPLK